MSKPVAYSDNSSFGEFCSAAVTVFLDFEEFQPANRVSMFYVKDSEAVTDRCRVTDETFSDVRTSHSATRWDDNSPKTMLYLYDSPESPQSSPPKKDEEKMMYGNSYTGKSHLKQIVRGKGSDASSQRSGQTDFSQRVLYRDGGKCTLCSETESLQGAHLIDHCLHTMVGIVKTFEDCRISGIQDTQNGLAMCSDCHSKFDNRSNGEQVFINPVTKKLKCLLSYKNILSGDH